MIFSFMHVHFMIYPSVILLFLSFDTPATTMGSMPAASWVSRETELSFQGSSLWVSLLLLVSYVFVGDFSCFSCTFLWVLASDSGFYDEHLLGDHTGPFPSLLSFLWDRGSLDSPDGTGTFSCRPGWLQSDREWLPSASLECWDSRWAPPHLAILCI